MHHKVNHGAKFGSRRCRFTALSEEQVHIHFLLTCNIVTRSNSNMKAQLISLQSQLHFQQGHGFINFSSDYSGENQKVIMWSIKRLFCKFTPCEKASQFYWKYWTRADRLCINCWIILYIGNRARSTLIFSHLRTVLLLYWSFRLPITTMKDPLR